jgi:NAD+ synthase (glutamine-hydrolysing)
MLRVSLAQANITVGDLSGNYRKILDFTKKARDLGSDFVVFPELVLCGYPPEDLLFKDHFISDSLKELHSLAKKVKGITAIVGFVDQNSRKDLYNAAAIIADGKIKGVYRKENLPNYGVFDEKRYFVKGENNALFKSGQVLCGINICEDIWADKPTVYWQTKQGAKVLINLSGSPYDLGKLKQREKLLVNLAKEHAVYVCYNNLVGGQDELVFDGGSLVINPKGQVIASGKQFEEDLITADLDIPARKSSLAVSHKKTIILPAAKEKTKLISTRKAKRYSELERIFHALVLGSRDYVQKNGFKKVVVGLSGGIDSSLVASIAKEAIGKKNVVGISMPSEYSSKATQSDAKKLAKNLGIKLIKVPIEDIFGSYLSTLKKSFKGCKTDVTEENIQARIRGNILMAFSNKFGWLVLTTGNKSEVAVGYCTLYGGMSGGFAVIKDVPKTLVYELAELIKVEKDIIPKSILTRAPSAELKKNQKDQDTLPAYKDLDPLIKGYVEKHQSLRKMTSKGQSIDVVKKVIKMVDCSEYKRRQSPPGIKITPRAFGKDWRLPITNKYTEC